MTIQGDGGQISYLLVVSCVIQGDISREYPIVISVYDIIMASH